MFYRYTQKGENMLELKEAGVQYITNETGVKSAVVLPIDLFQNLLEDLEDLAAIAERRDEPTTSHADLLAELKRDALLHN